MNDRRSRIRYSVCSSERLWSDCSTTILNFKIASEGLRPALLLRSSGFVSVTLSMSARKSSHRTIFLIVSSGSPLALIASSLRSTSKKPVCPMTRSLHPPMAHCGQRVRFVATWREEFFEVPLGFSWQPAREHRTVLMNFVRSPRIPRKHSHHRWQSLHGTTSGRWAASTRFAAGLKHTAGSGRCTASSASHPACAPTAARQRSMKSRRSSRRAGGNGSRERNYRRRLRRCLWMFVFIAPATPDGGKFVQDLANLFDIGLRRSRFRNLSSLLDHPRAQLLILRDGENGGDEVLGVGRIEEQGSIFELLFRPGDAGGYHGATQCECL